MHRPLRLPIALFCLAICPLAVADKLGDWAKRKMAEAHIPGMVIGVYKHGRPVKIGTYGFADLEESVKVRRNTVFEICSITKQFTSASILLLAEAGKLSLDDSVVKWISELPETWQPITLRHLMNHTSGITDDKFDFGLLSESSSLDSVKKMVNIRTPKPGEKWAYSNFGYWLLGHVIERASKQNYYEFLQTKIFARLGLKDTGPNIKSKVIARRAKGYGWDIDSATWVNQEMLTEKLGFGDGGLISTIDDLNDWSEALKKGKILSESSRKEMLRSALLEDGSVVWPEGMALRGYGAGVFLSGYDGHRVEKHSGGWADASAQLTRFLDDDLTVVVLTNVGDWAERPWIGEEIGSLFIGGYKLPEWTPTETVQSKATSEVAEMIKLIQQKKPVSSGLARDLATELSLNPAQFVPLVKGVDTTKLRFIRRVPQGKHPIDLYLSEGKVPMVVTVARDLTGLVEEISSFPVPR